MEMRLTPDQKIAGSTPAVLDFLFVFLSFFPNFYTNIHVSSREESSLFIEEGDRHVGGAAAPHL